MPQNLANQEYLHEDINSIILGGLQKIYQKIYENHQFYSMLKETNKKKKKVRLKP